MPVRHPTAAGTTGPLVASDTASAGSLQPDAAAGDPFPRARLGALIGRLPRYLRLAWGLAGEPRLARRHRAGLLAAAGYLASPIDLVPGIIPILGQLDDLAVALLAVRAALRALDPATRERHLAAVGLAPADLEDDLAALAVAAAWLTRRGIVVGRHLALLAAAASLAAMRAGVRVVRWGAPAMGRTGGRVVGWGAPAMARTGGRLARTSGHAAARAGDLGRDLLARRWRGGGAILVPEERGDPPAATDGAPRTDAARTEVPDPDPDPG